MAIVMNSNIKLYDWNYIFEALDALQNHIIQDISIDRSKRGMLYMEILETMIHIDSMPEIEDQKQEVNIGEI